MVTGAVFLQCLTITVIDGWHHRSAEVAASACVSRCVLRAREDFNSGASAGKSRRENLIAVPRPRVEPPLSKLRCRAKSSDCNPGSHRLQQRQSTLDRMVNLFRHHVPAATLLQLLIEAGL